MEYKLKSSDTTKQLVTCPPFVMPRSMPARSFLEAVPFTSASSGASGSTYRLTPKGRNFLQNDKVCGQKSTAVVLCGNHLRVPGCCFT